ncbi:HNH endonuclease signature motif containing protein [Rhizorhabdus sp.]|uniref:HNH endonuclease n=1 Tax=Rhizorhabdus sp. TaxID=1968843 RepID=UPI00344DFE68
MLCSDQCRTLRARRRSREKAQLGDARDRSPRACKCCGLVFAPKYGDRRRAFCSASCLRKQERRDARAAGKRDAGKNHRKRARAAGVPYEPVNRLKVFDRDGWKCQICGEKTPRRLLGTIDDRAPELDHRIPLSQGGPHTYENTQCACRACNISKGATRAAGQMNLFPRAA